MLRRGRSAAAATALTVETGRHEIHIDRLESARFLMLWPMAPAMDQSRVMGADLATSLLGEGRRSRLVSRLREELQIAETVDMDLTILERGSLVTLEVCCRDDQLIDVESTIHRELAALISCPVTRSELERAVRLVGNGLRFALESCGQVAGTAAAQSLPPLVLAKALEAGFTFSAKDEKELNDAFQSLSEAFEPHVATLVPLFNDLPKFIATALQLLLEDLRSMAFDKIDDAFKIFKFHEVSFSCRRVEREIYVLTIVLSDPIPYRVCSTCLWTTFFSQGSFGEVYSHSVFPSLESGR